MAVWLAHTSTLLEDCEDAWTNGVAGVTCTADGTYKQVGTYSAKMAVGSGVTSGSLLAYENFSSTDISATTHIGFWIMTDRTGGAVAGALQFLIDETNGCVSPEETLNVPALTINQWRYCVIAMVTPSALNAVLSVGIKTATIDQEAYNVYIDDVRAFSATSYSELSIRGLTRPEELEFWPPIQEQLLDGTISETISAYRRRITLELEPVTSLTDLQFLLTWAIKSEKYIAHTNDFVRVSLDDPTGHSLEWIGGFSEARKPNMMLLERSVRTTAPSSWSY